MKPEENIPMSVTLQADHDRLIWRLWCVTVALIAVGGLFWGGVLVVLSQVFPGRGGPGILCAGRRPSL